METLLGVTRTADKGRLAGRSADDIDAVFRAAVGVAVSHGVATGMEALLQRDWQQIKALGPQVLGQGLNEGLLKKPDRLQRSLFQRSKPDKLALFRAIDDC